MNNTIKTIFYYPKSLLFEDYYRLWRNGAIAPRTIVFAEDQKAIYKDGVQYGISDSADLKVQIEQIFNDNPYTLPVATVFGTESSHIGGIMAGDYLKVNDQGKLDFDESSFKTHFENNQEWHQIIINSVKDGINGTNGQDGLNAVIDRAGYDQYGVVKIALGGGIQCINGVLSISSTYSPGTGTGTGTNAQPYDDTALVNRLNGIDSEINNIKNTLAGIHNQDEQELDESVQQIIDEWQSFKDSNGYIGTNGWVWENDPNTGLRQYISQLGYIREGTGTWTTLVQKVNALEGRVNSIDPTSDGYDLTEAAIRAWIDQDPDSGATIANALMGSRYVLLDSDRVDANTIYWLESKFRTYATANKTFAEMVSDTSGDAISAISAIATSANGMIIATQTDISSMFGNKVAGQYTYADLNKAVAGLFVEGAQDATAAIKSVVENDQALIDIVAQHTNNAEAGLHALTYKTQNGQVVYRHGTGSSAVEDTNPEPDGVPVLNDNVAAHIVAQINNGSSSIQLDANHIDVTGVLNAGLATIGSVVSGKLSAGDAVINAASIKGDIQAKSFTLRSMAKGPNYPNWKAFEFTTVTRNMLDPDPDNPDYMSGIADAGIPEGTLIGIVYNQDVRSENEPLYFFDLAPVSNGTFSADDELFYYITGAQNGKVNVTLGPIYYYVTDSNDSCYHTYISSPRANGVKINTTSNSARIFERKNYTFSAYVNLNGSYTLVSNITVFREVIFANGVKQYTGEGYILGLYNAGLNIQSYTISNNLGTISTTVPPFSNTSYTAFYLNISSDSNSITFGTTTADSNVGIVESQQYATNIENRNIFTYMGLSGGTPLWESIALVNDSSSEPAVGE